MANWASTSYRIEGNEEDLKTLEKLISDFGDEKRPAMTPSASRDWEGNIILALGRKTEGSFMRGFIQTCELADGVLSIEAEEAWNTTDFRFHLESHFDNMKVYFATEEEGMEIYTTNDTEGRYFPYRFMLHYSIDGNAEWEYFNSEKEALAYIAKVMDKEEVTKEWIEEWNEEQEDEDDNFIQLVEYSLVD